jgi:glycosyltransferase involved in cell wall biosynthesis
VNVAVIIPTLGRPHRVAPIMENLAATAPDCTVYFVAEADDTDTITAVEQHPDARLVVNRRSPSYAGAVNTALEDTDEDLLFVGADDLLWHDGWLPPLLELIGEFGMVGTNDLGNPEVAIGIHATHFLVRRDYAITGCIDEPGVLFHEGYDHNWVDREAVATARFRGEFAPCLASAVEHLHWAWAKAQMDPTYEKARTREQVDAQLYRTRMHLWGGL